MAVTKFPACTRNLQDVFSHSWHSLRGCSMPPTLFKASIITSIENLQINFQAFSKILVKAGKFQAFTKIWSSADSISGVYPWYSDSNLSHDLLESSSFFGLLLFMKGYFFNKLSWIRHLHRRATTLSPENSHNLNIFNSKQHGHIISLTYTIHNKIFIYAALNAYIECSIYASHF